MRFFTFLARRFVAGETIDEAITAVKALNLQKIKATLDILGENVRSQAEAEAYADHYIQLLDEIEKSGVDSNVSLKLTMLGLDIGTEFCQQNVRRVVQKAKSLNNFVRIDMEGSAYTQRTLDIFEALEKEFPQHVGIVTQACLRRTEDDMKKLSALNASVRLCKGAYKEPASVAFQEKSQVNGNFDQLMKQALGNGGRIAVASHDEELIRSAIKYVEEKQLAKDGFEFQMLYGMRRKRAEQLAQAGYRVRSYVPFGTHWFPYFYRRLRERKENVLFVLKNLFRD